MCLWVNLLMAAAFASAMDPRPLFLEFNHMQAGDIHQMTRYSSYRSDKLSRLAPTSELIKRHSPCGIRSLAEGRTLGAHFAGRLAYILS